MSRQGPSAKEIATSPFHDTHSGLLKFNSLKSNAKAKETAGFLLALLGNQVFFWAITGCQP